MDPSNFPSLLPRMGFTQSSNHPNGIVDSNGKLDDDVSQFLASFAPPAPNQHTPITQDARTTTPPFPPPQLGPTPTTTTTAGPPPSEIPTATPEQEPQVQIKAEGGPQAETPDISIPDCIVFSSGNAFHVIPGQPLNNLPRLVLQKLLQLPELEGKGHPALYLGVIAPSLFENLVRIHQFAEHRDYEPFCISKSAQPKFQSPRDLARIEYQDPKTKETKPWEENETYAIFAAPGSTRNLFTLELDTYLFAMELGYTDLQKRSRERIFRCYPKTTAGVFVLIEKVFPRAAKAGDTKMTDRIREYINSNGKSLTSTKAYVSVMKTHMEDNSPLGKVLWETYISSSEALRRDFERNPREKVAEKVKKESVPEQSSPTKLTDSLESSIIASKLRWVVQSIEDGALVKATQDGYGTLRTDDGTQKRWARNQDFKFVKDELFCIDRSKQSMVSTNHNNVVVVNSRGEIGDIFRSLTRPVSFDELGTSPEANGLARGFNEGMMTPPPPPMTFKKRKYSYDTPGEYVPPPRW